LAQKLIPFRPVVERNSNICATREARPASVRYGEKRNADARVSRVAGLEKKKQQARHIISGKLCPESSGHGRLRSSIERHGYAV
jgi:hypothetical protein